MTHGQWGDGMKTVSALELALEAEGQPGAVTVVVIPQASLNCKAGRL